MPRPKSPLLSRDLVTKTAIKVIDRQGLAALSLPVLAAELSVRPPSLYHHFRDKAEILADVARAIALSATAPNPADFPNWIEWMVELSNSFRTAVLKHRNAAPIFIQFLPRDLLIGAYDRSAQVMAEAGVPAGLHVLILDGCDRLSLGSILMESSERVSDRASSYSGFDPATHARLAEAVRAYEASAEELFKAEIRAFLRGVIEIHGVPLPKSVKTSRKSSGEARRSVDGARKTPANGAARRAPAKSGARAARS